jgi:hypothetical protein
MDVGNRWWDEDEEVQIDDEAEKIVRMKRANESAQPWAKFFLRVTPPAPAASSSPTTLLEDLAQMQRTSEKPDTLRFENANETGSRLARSTATFRSSLKLMLLWRGKTARRSRRRASGTWTKSDGTSEWTSK